ncbi:MAG: zeta toxin family protein [Pirellulaceae bacterium]|nr:zeta toxin family protein [Pirellulaceae bacterium]
MADSPKVVVIAGPNGAGKSTAASRILQDALAVQEFVNADVIARGLSAFKPESVALAAGRAMLQRLDELAAERAEFAFETTLASRSFAPWLKRLIASGYEFHLFFVWLPNAEAAIARVQERVRSGGHYVPEETVRRRFHSGLKNFFELYRPLAMTWQVVNNENVVIPQVIAQGIQGLPPDVADESLWNNILREYGHEA